MALVHEETKHEFLGAEIMVSQRQRGEVIEDWAICHLDIDSMNRRTPQELVELGEWLIAQGKRIRRSYRKNGAPIVGVGEFASGLGKGCKAQSNLKPDADGVQTGEAQSYAGPKKWTPEEAAQGNKGIRWVTETYVAGRPSEHDVLEYLEQRGKDAKCGCDECKTRLAHIAGVPARVTSPSGEGNGGVER